MRTRYNSHISGYYTASFATIDFGVFMMKFLEELTDLVFVEDLPQKSDIIFIPGGRYGALALQAARLYKEGMAPLILPSGKYSKLVGFFEGPADMPDSALKNCPTEWAFMDHILRSQGRTRGCYFERRSGHFYLRECYFLPGRQQTVSDCIYARLLYAARLTMPKDAGSTMKYYIRIPVFSSVRSAPRTYPGITGTWTKEKLIQSLARYPAWGISFTRLYANMA